MAPCVPSFFIYHTKLILLNNICVMVVTFRPLGIQFRYESYVIYNGRAESMKGQPCVNICFPFEDYLNCLTKQAEIFMVTIDIMLHYNLHGATIIQISD